MRAAERTEVYEAADEDQARAMASTRGLLVASLSPVGAGGDDSAGVAPGAAGYLAILSSAQTLRTAAIFLRVIGGLQVGAGVICCVAIPDADMLARCIALVAGVTSGVLFFANGRTIDNDRLDWGRRPRHRHAEVNIRQHLHQVRGQP